MSTQQDAIKRLYPVASRFYKIDTEEEFREKMQDQQKRKKLYDGLLGRGLTTEQLGDYDKFDAYITQSFNNPANVPIQEPERPGLIDAQPISTDAQAQPQNNAHAQSYAQQAPPTANGEKAQAILRTGIEQGLKKHNEKQDALLQTKEEGLQLQQMYDLFEKENEDAIFLAKTKRATASVPGMVMPASAYTEDEADVIKQRNTLQSALELNKKTQEILAAPSRFDDSNAFANFGKGAASKATDIDFWTFGITNIARNLNTRDVAMKLQKAQDQYGEDIDIDTVLTEPEKALMGAFFNNLHASALRADDLSLGYQAGQGAMDSAKFMAEFILTGGISKAATKGATKALESWIVKNIASKAGRTLAKGGLAVAKGLVGTAARTPVMLSTYSNITDQAVQYDENGRLRNSFEAVGMGFLDSFIENLSESMGEHIVATIKLPFTSLISKIPETGFTKFFQNLSKTGAYKLMKQGGWNGFAGEYFEEWYGNSLRALTGNKEALQDFATVEQQLITLASFAPITILGGAVSTAQYASAQKNFQNATLALKDILKDNGYKTSQAEYVMDLIMDTTPSQMAKKVAPIINQMALETEGDAGNLLTGISEFIRTKSIMQGYDGIYEAEHQEKRAELDQDLQNEIGEYTNKKGEVEMAVDKDGNANYVLSDVADELEPLIVIKGLDGQTKMVSKSEYEANYTPSVLTSKDEYLSEMIMTKQEAELAEETKIEEDANFLNSIELGVPQYFNINGVMTEGTPQAITPDGSITVHFGNHVEMLTADQYKALNQPTAVTAAQTEDLAKAEQEQAEIKEQKERAQEQAQPVQEEKQPLAPEEAAQGQVEPEVPTKELPKTEDGETDFDALLDADPETYAQELAKAIGEEKAANTMSALAKQTDAQIEKLQKRLEKETSTNKIVSINRNIDQLQQRRDALTGLIIKGSKPQTPQTPEVTGAQTTKTAQPVQAGEIGQNIVEKWDNAPKDYGIEETFTLPNGKEIKGRWVLSEAGAATPSHDPHTLQQSEGFPVTKDGKTANSNDYTKKLDMVELVSADYDRRAIDNPVYVKRGAVLSGNNRTISGILAAERGTDKKYIQALTDKARKLGFTPEQISKYKHPRVVIEVTDDLPITTETFAMFNRDDKKQQSPTELAVVASKMDNTRTIGLISRELDGYERLSDLYQNPVASATIAKYLVEGGLITQFELSPLFANNSFTSGGKDFLESVLVGSVLREDQINILDTEGMKSTRQRVVKAIVPLIENSKLREEGRIIDDVNTGIMYLYGAKKAGMTLREYFLQSNMFEAATYDLNGVRNALMLQGTEKDFRDYVQLANKRLKDPIANMFTGEIESKDDLYKELENQYNDEQRRTIEAARAANAQSGAATNDQGAVLPGDPRDNEPGGSGISADAGEQTEASPATNEGSETEVDTQPTHSEQEEDPSQEQSDQGMVSVFDAAKKAKESTEERLQREADEATAEFLEAFNDLQDNSPGIIDNTAEKQAKMLIAGTKMVAAYTKLGVYKFADLVNRLAKKGIQITEDLLSALKKAYGAFAAENDIDELDEMKAIRAFKLSDINTKNDQKQAEPKDSIRKLGTGSNVYFDSNGIRVNDYQNGKVLMNVESREDFGGPAFWNIEFDTPEEAVKIANELAKIYPNGVPQAVLLDRVVKDMQSKGAEVKPEESSGMVSVFAAAEKAKEKPRQEKKKTLSDYKLSNVYIPESQKKAVREMWRNGSEEIESIIQDVEKSLEDIPSKPQNKGDQSIVYAHYFIGQTHIYILDTDRDEGLMYTYTILNGDYEMSEFGYQSIEEVTNIRGMELDFYWDPAPLNEVLYQEAPNYFDNPKKETENNGQETRSTETIEAETEAIEAASESIRSESENVGSDQQRAGDIKEQAGEQVEKIETLLNQVDEKLAELKLTDKEYPTEGIEADYPINVLAKGPIKKDATAYVRAVAAMTGLEHDTDRKGKTEIVNVNIAPAGGDVTFVLWSKKNPDYGVYVSIKYSPDYRGSWYDHYRVEGSILWRVTTKQDKWRGLSNQWTSADVTAKELAETLLKGLNQELRSRGLEQEINEVKVTPEKVKNTKIKPVKVRKTDENQLPLFQEEDSITNKDNNNEYKPKRGSETESAGVGKTAQQNAGEPNRGRVDRSDTDNNGPDQLRGRRTSDTSSEQTSGTERRNANNNRNERGVDYFPKATKARFNANIEAIKLMRELNNSGVTVPTREQMGVLRKFSGWGGLGSYFNDKTPENQTLLSVLDSEEYQRASESVWSSYYTPSVVIDSMWSLAQKLGFKRGSILESSAGIGSIIGYMPQSISNNSAITAVEIDPISGGILKLLYPDANVSISGFEDTEIRNGSVDLAITNVPFVTGLNVYDKVDKDLSTKFKNIHDFVIAKNIRKLKEGGIGIFITTKGTLDSSKKLREWVVTKGSADVIGAFRLNNETFEGTSVTSDIIVVRKRIGGKVSTEAIDVLSTAVERSLTYDTGDLKWNNKLHIYDKVFKTVDLIYNSYFIKNQNSMGGVMAFGFEKNDTYRPLSMNLYPKSTINQNERLTEWVNSFNETEFDTKSQNIDRGEREATSIKEGQLFIDKDGKIAISSRGFAADPGINNQKVKGHAKTKVLRDYNAIKDAINSLLDYQTANKGDEGLKPLLARLNRVYDLFVANYGYLNNNTSISWLRKDVEFPAIAAIEKYQETKTIDGIKIIKASKTKLFTERVVGVKAEPQPQNIKDAVIASMHKYGTIDVQYIASKLEISDEAVTEEIIREGYGFSDPESGAVVPRHLYLSGNVREKLRIAENGNIDGIYEKNIEALNKVIPLDIPTHLIDIGIGSTWLPAKVFIEYFKDVYDVEVAVRQIEGTWVVEDKDNTSNQKNIQKGVYSSIVDKRVKGHELAAAAMNNRNIVFSKQVKYSDGTSETINDKDATSAATARIQEIKEEFKDYIQTKIASDADLSAGLKVIYNEKYNAIAPLKIDDVFVPERLPGTAEYIKLYPHQKKAAIRGTMQPLMFAHEVGSGKTFTLVATAMEMRRLGTAKKPMIVVQNATIGQFVSEAKALYPNAKILSLTDSDRDRDGRLRFYSNIKYNDWDMVVIPQSTFDMIPDSPERLETFIREKIDEKLHTIEALIDSGEDQRTIRQYEKELEDLYGELAGRTAKKAGSKKKNANNEKRKGIAVSNAATRAEKQLDRKVDDVQYFDDLGVDALLIDEVHAYKKLGYETTMARGVKGIDTSRSKRAASLYIKSKAILDQAGGKNIIFATGTPITNTTAELWTFMRFLLPKDVLEQNDLKYFDDFARNFGSIEQVVEWATSGKYRENTRFARYINIPELVRIWASHSDTILTKDVGYINDKIPKIETGKAQDVYMEQSDSLVAILKAVRRELENFENMSGKQKKENSHIPIVMYGIAKRAAIDTRLVSKEAPDEPLSKTNRTVTEILKTLEETKAYKGTVAVFCDNQNRMENGKVTFNIFEDIKQKLIAQGIPESQIAIMRGNMNIKSKQKLFAEVNEGNVRVIMGSTGTLGTGVNIQERLHTLIHIDAPDLPMQYTQRNGRILRQGNLHKEWGKEVRILRFGVVDSLDITSYQRLDTKSKFINSIMDGNAIMNDSMEARSIEDEGDDIFTDTVAHLSGSQFALKKNFAEKALRRLLSKKKQHEQDQIYIENQLRRNELKTQDSQKRVAELENIVSQIKKHFPNGEAKEIYLAGHKVSGALGLDAIIKDYVNKPLNEAIEAARNNTRFTKEKFPVVLKIDGVEFTITTVVSRDTTYDQKFHGMRVIMHRRVYYDAPTLGLNEEPIGGGYVNKVVEEIIKNVIPGAYYEQELNTARRSLDNIQRENQAMLERRGKPFDQEDELEIAQKRVEEYDKAMRKELAEKEAKYSQRGNGEGLNITDISTENDDAPNNDEEDVDQDGNGENRYRMVQEAEEATDFLEEESLYKDRNNTTFTDNNGNNKGRNSILQEDAVQMQLSWAEQVGNVPAQRAAAIVADPGIAKVQQSAGYNPIIDHGFSAVERVLSNNGAVTFMGNPLTGPAKIKWAGDVAFLFKNLESASSENAFITLIDKENNYRVLYLSTGNEYSTIIDFKSIPAAIKEFDAVKICMVHNHPSGSLKPSDNDIKCQTRIGQIAREMGIEAMPGIIINLDTGKYAEFTQNFTNHPDSPRNEDVGDVSPVDIYAFDRQVLYMPSSQRIQLNAPDKVAQFISQQKRGTKGKVHVLILDRALMVSRYFLMDGNLSTSEMLNTIWPAVGKHGIYVMLASNDQFNNVQLSELKDGLKLIDSQLLDVLTIKQDKGIITNYESLANQGLLDEQVLYEKQQTMLNDMVAAKKFMNDKGSSTYTELTEEEIPEKTQVAYKLMRYFNNKPGVLYPLYAKDEAGKKGFKKGVWYKAERQSVKIGGKNLAERPGIHAVDLPLFLQGKVRKSGETRVWAKVLMPAMSEKTQAESDNTTLLPNGQRSGIRERVIGPKEAYSFKTNPNATGSGVWPIAGSMKVERVLSDAEVEKILVDNGKEDYVTLSMSGDPEIRYRLIGEEGAGNLDRAEDATIRLDNLRVAREMEDQGMDAKAIRLATGWERGADKKWRYEISQIKAKDISDTTQYGPRKLEEAIDADELFKAYPELRGIPIEINHDKMVPKYTDEFRDNFRSFMKGATSIYNDGYVRMYIEYPWAESSKEGKKLYPSNTLEAHADDVLSVISHEIQHIIQQIEYFAPGSSVAISWSDPEHVAKNKFDAYRRSAGEVEARNVQTRMGMSEEEARRTLIQETEDVAREDQIVLQAQLGVAPIRYRSLSQAGFYSTVEYALERLPQEKGTPDQMKAMLLKNGAKEAEMDWMGYDQQFKGKSVTKQEIQDWIDQNRIEVQEVVKENTMKPISDKKLSKESSERISELQDFIYKTNWLKRSVADGLQTKDENEKSKAELNKKFPNYSITDAENEINTTKNNPNNYIEYTYNDVVDDTKYSQYTVPGGKDYRELLLTMPRVEKPFDKKITLDNGKYYIDGLIIPFDTEAEAIEYNNRVYGGQIDKNSGNFKSGHFDEPNILAHIRFNERTDSKGDKVLFLEEIQSDWAQEGKKKGFRDDSSQDEYNSVFAELVRIRDEKEAYRKEIDPYREYSTFYLKSEYPRMKELDEKVNQLKDREYELRRKREAVVPYMPFKQTDQWVNLAFRRMMRYAAENGFDRIAWTNGEQQAERYDLSKQVSQIDYWKSQDEGYTGLTIYDIKGTPIDAYNGQEFKNNEIENIIGKELALKILNDDYTKGEEVRTIKGDSLKVGGFGMKAFYDSIIPKAAKKLGKPFGATIEEVAFPVVAKEAYNETTEELELSPEAEEIQDRFMESQAEEGDYELEDYVQDMKDAGYEVLFENGEPVNLKKITTGQTFTVQSLPVTYAMKEAVSAGVPLFRPSNASSIRERIIARDRLESVVDKLNIKVNIVNRADLKNEKQKRAKGFYEPRTGNITIVLDNHKTADDAIATLLHEAVAHKGLRNLFGADFDRFLDNVYQSAGKEVRAEINKLIAKNGWDTRLATEEYLATLAESTDYDQNESLWRKIKNFFMDMLRRAGIKMDGVLTDADLRYILQRSYDRLTDPSGPGGVFDAARDAQIRRRVGLNSDNDTRYRSNKNAAQDKVEQFANNAYDARLNETMSKIREAHQDSMLSLKILQEEVAKASRKEIQTFEDAYLAENHISSKNLYEKEHFMANYYEPMSKAIRSLSDKLDGEYQSVVTYAMAKHGLERNIKLAERDAKKMHAKWKAELDKKLAQELIDQAKYDKEIKRLEAKYDETVAYFRGRDYSGLTALFPASESVEELPDVALAEAMAQELVDQVEEAAPEEVQELWSRVNAATKKSLYKTYETGILTRSVYENIRDMYDYYIPLRGFSETTADDVYEYLQFDRSSFSPPVLTARGRKSMADDPFATIGTMAESAIQQGNNNWMKQKFLNMALNHESNLISVREMWYENKGTEENPDWIQAMPDIEPGASAMEVNQAYETFEQRMTELAGIGMAKKSMKGLNIPYRTLGKQAQEHSVIVKSAGKEYVIFINGNPRAAQAINGLTNPDVSDARKKIMRANRWLAANYTTRSPKFMLRNLSRDTIYSLFNIYVKEDKAYNRRFRANLARNYVSIWKLMRDYSQNKLDVTTQEGAYMQEFLANGGETGYTVLKRVDEYKRIMSDLMAQAKGGKVITLKKALRYVFDQIGFANRCIEDICRFTAFTTSRQMGRSVEESIADAKNVSVNFNKKGSGQGYGASTLRTAYLFYNAGVQGLDNFVSLYKKNPNKFTIGTASMLAAGALMPFFNQLIAMALGGDPDEYLDMPEWIRRNNMVVGGNGFYITIPLPIELRAIYGIGDIAYMASAGRMKNKNIAGEILGQLTDVLPVDPVGNNTGVANLVPDIVSPLFENLINEDFTGRPIFKNNSFNRYYPAFTKAYAGTNKALVRASELINRIGGGDDVTKGWVENNITIADVNNPAKWEHIFEGYFGGALTTANEAAKTLSMIWDPDQRILRNVPLANVLLQHNDERTSNSFINDMYYYYKEEYDKVKQSVTKYGQDPEKYSKQQRSLEDKDRYKRYLVFEEYLDEIKDVEKELKEAPDNEAKRNLNAYYNRLKSRLVDELMKRD